MDIRCQKPDEEINHVQIKSEWELKLISVC